MNVTKDTDFDKWEKYTHNQGCLKIQTSAQKQHFTICCDEGAEEHGTVVFAIVSTVPCSGFKAIRNSNRRPERWNVETKLLF